MWKDRRFRLAALAFGLVTCIVVGKLTGLTDRLDVRQVRDWVESAGAWGIALFLLIFSVGQLLHVPGMVFVAAAIFLYGRFAGGGLALIGAVTAVTFSFVLVRAVGGKALGEIERPLMKKLLAHIDQRPIRVVAMLRLIFWMLPPLNYALALTNVRLRDYVLGSTLGLLIPVGVAAFCFEWLFEQL
ncbi:MAG: TVP38/TMEM64 family protein [Planctomycetales bacterium]|nr:TVP38/TMEM64 family protein [Planctomycetales bacterium]